MTFRSILLSYIRIAFVAVGFFFSLMMVPSAKAMNIYNEYLGRIGIDAGLDFNSVYQPWEE